MSYFYDLEKSGTLRRPATSLARHRDRPPWYIQNRDESNPHVRCTV